MKWKLFIRLTLGFILFAVIGTLSHECGHYVAAKIFGRNASVHYGYTDYGDGPNDIETARIRQIYLKEITAGTPVPERKKFEAIIKNENREEFWLTAGGPIQTMLTGMIGIVLLIIYRKKIIGRAFLNFRQWLLVFISLFWLRQVANAVTGLMIPIPQGISQLQIIRGDEQKLASFLGLPLNSIVIGTAAAGLLIAGVVIFKFIPRLQRPAFMLAGMVGGIAGYIIWLLWLGPIVMP